MSILNTETLHARLAEVKARHPEPPWAERIAVTEYAVGVLICQAPGHPNDRHYHLRDEWWIVLEGESSTATSGPRAERRRCSASYREARVPACGRGGRMESSRRLRRQASR